MSTYDIDFLTDAETMLNISDWFRQSFSPEAFGLSQGMLPHQDIMSDPGRRGFPVDIPIGNT